MCVNRRAAFGAASSPGCDRSNILNEPKNRYPHYLPIEAPCGTMKARVQDKGREIERDRNKDRQRERERVHAYVYIVYNSDLRHWTAINVINGCELLTILILSRCNRNNKVLLYPYSTLSSLFHYQFLPIRSPLCPRSLYMVHAPCHISILRVAYGS